MDRILMFIATGAYSGYLPKAPGTWGSAVGVLIWLCISRMELLPFLALVTVLFFVGIVSGGAAEKILDRVDPHPVVIDEIVGQLIALTAAPLHPVPILLSFLLFRFFDIWKPYPANWFDRHISGGWGIMLDDVAAGLYAWAVLQIGLRLYGF